MIIYETINLINGKRYIGKDIYNDPTYLGSGKIFKQALTKYGRHNFKKIILDVCDSEDHMNERERFWIKKMNARESKLYYNIGEGGIGGDNITHHPNKKEFIDKMISIKSTSNGMTGKKHAEYSKLLQKEASVGRYTLEWFIERYGESGQERYDARNVNLTATRLGDKNPAYKHVDEHELTDLIMNTKLCQNHICDRLSIGKTAIYAKYKLYYNCNTLKEAREKLMGYGWDGRSRRKNSNNIHPT